MSESSPIILLTSPKTKGNSRYIHFFSTLAWCSCFSLLFFLLFFADPFLQLPWLFRAQSGSGKSHAVLGSRAAPGLVPRLADHLLHALHQHNASSSTVGGGEAAAFATLACVEVDAGHALRDLLPNPTAAPPLLTLTESDAHGVRLLRQFYILVFNLKNIQYSAYLCACPRPQLNRCADWASI